MLGMRNNLFTIRVVKPWSSLPRAVMESPSMERLQSHADMVLRVMVEW